MPPLSKFDCHLLMMSIRMGTPDPIFVYWEERGMDLEMKTFCEEHGYDVEAEYTRFQKMIQGLEEEELSFEAENKHIYIKKARTKAKLRTTFSELAMWDDELAPEDLPYQPEFYDYEDEEVVDEPGEMSVDGDQDNNSHENLDWETDEFEDSTIAKDREEQAPNTIFDVALTVIADKVDQCVAMEIAFPEELTPRKRKRRNLAQNEDVAKLFKKRKQPEEMLLIEHEPRCEPVNTGVAMSNIEALQQIASLSNTDELSLGQLMLSRGTVVVATAECSKAVEDIFDATNALYTRRNVCEKYLYACYNATDETRLALRNERKEVNDQPSEDGMSNRPPDNRGSRVLRSMMKKKSKMKLLT